jgi:hypothetical protein
LEGTPNPNYNNNLVVQRPALNPLKIKLESTPKVSKGA